MPALRWVERHAIDSDHDYIAMASKLPRQAPHLDAFAASDPHRHITRRLAPHMHPSRFAFFAIPGGDVPLTWDDVTVRLDPATPSSGVPIHDEGP